MSEGVDYAFSKPSVAALVAAGKRYAIRYGGPGTSDKWLTPTEARDLAAAELGIVANAEGAAGGLAGGWNVGASWARSADPYFRSCGMPADRPIYYSCDFDVTPAGWPAVADALRGAASVTGLARVGLYGGYRACQWARRDNVAIYLWQTYAWSTWQDPDGVRRLHWLPGTHLQQYRNGVTIDGADCDLDRAMQDDYGQWQPGISLGGEDDMTPEEHIWLQNAGSIIRAFAEGAASVEQFVPYGDQQGQKYILDLAPYWKKVGASLSPEAIAAVAAAAAKGANEGVASLTLDIKLEGSAAASG